jgi:hypothetical protein
VGGDFAKFAELDQPDVVDHGGDRLFGGKGVQDRFGRRGVRQVDGDNAAREIGRQGPREPDDAVTVSGQPLRQGPANALGGPVIRTVRWVIESRD